MENMIVDNKQDSGENMESWGKARERGKSWGKAARSMWLPAPQLSLSQSGRTLHVGNILNSNV